MTVFSECSFWLRKRECFTMFQNLWPYLTQEIIPKSCLSSNAVKNNNKETIQDKTTKHIFKRNLFLNLILYINSNKVCLPYNSKKKEAWKTANQCSYGIDMLYYSLNKARDNLNNWWISWTFLLRKGEQESYLIQNAP
jgi:hypothetical protein